MTTGSANEDYKIKYTNVLPRLNKLRQYAANKDKTVTQIVEDWIDRLPITEIDKNSNTP
ncbi:hypothetical protein [Microseira wollei]|uniref:CopG domain protein DNA-binding domain protein n=1 Tax=Microseira wollei NIES-4236 TaxID=2530354 RepID=A0AAV3X299_9CYAN|nr:hypothetical protein [Microseira wollei]GET36078.1 hypothetical protein MiSe_08260 [Microseira wollei NIES-4236]